MEISEGLEVDLSKTNKHIAVFITILGLFLAIAETMAKGAQMQSLSSNVQASNLWSFYQAKSIRQNTLRTAAEQMEVDIALAKDPAVKQMLEKRVAAWKMDAARYQSEPKVGPHHENMGEGRQQLQQRALVAEEARDIFTNKYHCFEIAAAAFQIAIVMAGVYLLVHVIYLFWMVAGLAAVGLAFSVMGIVSPETIHVLLPH